MPRPRAVANSTRAANVVRIRTATAPAGVFSQATAPVCPANGLSRTEIFLIRRIVLDQNAAIDGQRHAGDHARPITRKKQNGVGDILRLTHAAEWDFARAHGFAFLGRDRAAKSRCGRAWTDGIDPDS